MKSCQFSGLRPAYAIKAAIALFVAAQGCFVTQAGLNEKINEFDQYLLKREERSKADAAQWGADADRRIEDLKKSLQALDATVRALKEEIAGVRTNMGVAFESAERVRELGDKVEKALEEIQAVEGKLRRTVEALGGRVDTTMDKYRDILLEEKRVLTERLRALNESLRAMDTGSGNGQEKPK